MVILRSCASRFDGEGHVVTVPVGENKPFVAMVQSFFDRARANMGMLRCSGVECQFYIESRCVYMDVYVRDSPRHDSPLSCVCVCVCVSIYIYIYLYLYITLFLVFASYFETFE